MQQNHNRRGVWADAPVLDVDEICRRLTRLRSLTATAKNARHLAAASGKPSHQPPHPADLLAPEFDLAVRALKALPNDGPFDERNDWISVAYAFRGAAGDGPDAANAWIGWCSTWHGNGDPAEDVRVWRSLSAPHTGWRQLLEKVFEHNRPAYDELKYEEARIEVSSAPVGNHPALVTLCGKDATSQASAAETALDTLVSAGVEFFCTPGGRTCINYNGRNAEIGGGVACRRIVNSLLKAAGRRRLSKTPYGEFIEHARAEAMDGPVHEVHVRFAADPDRLWIDLADETEMVIEVSAAGWHLLHAAQVPVRFERHDHMLPLPHPAGAPVRDFLHLLRRHINLPPVSVFGDACDQGVRAEAAILLAMAGWSRPVGELPFLVISGEQGSGKSLMASRIKELLDPSAAPLLTQPHDEAELFIVARAHGLPVFDNLSRIGGAMSDAFCRLATGSAFLKRKLYTDADTIAVQAKRGAVLSAIPDDLMRRSDLRDRSIWLATSPIDPNRRRPRNELDGDWQAARPEILAAWLDTLSKGLRRLPGVILQNHRLPRLSDAAQFSEALAQGLGWRPGLLLEAEKALREESMAGALDLDPVALALNSLLSDPKTSRGTSGLAEWSGTPTDLKTVLDLHAMPGAGPLPANAAALGKYLTRIQTDLRQGSRIGIESRKSGRRYYTIRKLS